jgi:hypothetical protein
LPKLKNDKIKPFLFVQCGGRAHGGGLVDAAYLAVLGTNFAPKGRDFDVKGQRSHPKT